ncbi:MAG: Rab family GTPase [Nitrososphaerales archaeon]
MLERTFKVLFVGDKAVGKTTLLNRILSNSFKSKHLPEIGANIAEKDFKFTNTTVRLLFWDVETTSSNKMGIGKIFADTNAVVSLFDVCNPRTLNIAEKQYTMVRWIHTPSLWLVGNKIDLTEYRIVDKTEAMKRADKLKVNYKEISAKTGENVKDLLTSVLKDIIEARLKELKVSLSE